MGRLKPDFEAVLRSRAAVQANLFSESGDGRKTLLCRLPADWKAPELEPSIRWQPELKRSAASARRLPMNGQAIQPPCRNGDARTFETHRAGARRIMAGASLPRLHL